MDGVSLSRGGGKMQGSREAWSGMVQQGSSPRKNRTFDRFRLQFPQGHTHTHLGTLVYLAPPPPSTLLWPTTPSSIPLPLPPSHSLTLTPLAPTAAASHFDIQQTGTAVTCADCSEGPCNFRSSVNPAESRTRSPSATTTGPRTSHRAPSRRSSGTRALEHAQGHSTYSTTETPASHTCIPPSDVLASHTSSPPPLLPDP